MADYFVASGGSNTSPYDTWAKAATSLATAIAAATVAGDRVIIQYDAVPATDAELAANVTYTFAGNISLISASNNGGSAFTPTEMGELNWIGNSTANRFIDISGGYACYIYGITFRVAGTTTGYVNLAASLMGADYIYENCYFWFGNTATSTSLRAGGASISNSSGCVRLINPTIRFSNSAQSLLNSCNLKVISGKFHSSSSSPTTSFIRGNTGAVSYAFFDGFDFSNATGMIVAGNVSTATPKVYLDNCSMPSSYTLLATQTRTNLSGAEVFLSNCANGDTHYAFEFANPLGTLQAVTTPYFDTGAKYDGSNAVCWKIVTTANCSYYTPFVSPWIEKYHSGTSAITPYLEILRNDSTTAFNDDQVWGEFSVQATNGSVLPVFKNDRKALVASASAQANGSGLASWTGESGTAWSGKIDSGTSVTPAEIGTLRTRVCVGAASTTVYVDPFIRT